jgi:pimeloyl-ACP methyl ester carboxylesterase
LTPIVLIHGGGFDSRCWDLLIPHLAGPSLSVDLPGRGDHPAPLESVDFAACAASVQADINDAGFDEIVLVGHSLAGCSMPAMLGLFGQRVRHAVFLGCTVPEHGKSAFDTLDPEFQALAHSQPEPPSAPAQSATMSPEVAKIVIGDDLSEEQFQWCVERLVPDAPRLSSDPVDLTPLQCEMPRTWVRTVNDLIVSAVKQTRFAANVGNCPIVDIESGHMAMVGQPEKLAAILNTIGS